MSHEAVQNSDDRQHEGVTSKSASPSSCWIVRPCGELKPFGLESLVADLVLYSRTIDDSDTEACVNATRATMTFREPLSMSSIASGLKGTPFDVFKLSDVVVSYQDFEGGANDRQEGWHIDAEIVVDESFDELYNVLADFLHSPRPSFHVRASLGRVQSLSAPLNLSSFVLVGSVGETSPVSIVVCEEVSITRLGIELRGTSSTKVSSKGALTQGVEYGYAVFGTFDFHLDGWKKPVALDFRISCSSGALFIRCESEPKWMDAFGVRGLTVEEVSLTTYLRTSDPFKSLSFTAAARFSFGKAYIGLLGAFSMDGTFSFTAGIENWTYDDLNNLYSQFFDGSLSQPDFDLRIARASITIASGPKISLSIVDVTINGHAAVGGSFDLSTKGIGATAYLNGACTVCENFEISDAYAEVFIPLSGGEARLILMGSFKWDEHEFTVGCHLYRDPGEKKFEYSIYGYFYPKDGTSLAELLPILDGCDAFHQISLDYLALAYSSKENAALPVVGKTKPPSFTVKRGFQIVCALKTIPSRLEELSKKDASTFLAYLSWSGSKGLGLSKSEVQIGIQCSDTWALPFADGIEAGNIDLSVILADRPDLRLSCDVKIPVGDGQPKLEFNVGCALDVTGDLALYGRMKSQYWVNPFGLAPDLKLGPKIGLGASINVATLVPTGFMMAASFTLQELVVGLEMEINSVHPEKQYLKLHIGKLNISDVAKLAKTLMGLNITISPDVLYISMLDLYVSASQRSENQPQGCSFKADMLILGKRAEVDAAFSKEMLKIHAQVDPFNIGSYSISSKNGGKAMFSLELDSAAQKGAIDFWLRGPGLDVSAKGLLTMQPVLQFSFDFEVNIDSSLRLKVHATANSLDTKSPTQDSKQTQLGAVLTSGMQSSSLDAFANTEYTLSASFDADPDAMRQFSALIRTSLDADAMAARLGKELVEKYQPGEKVSETDMLLAAVKLLPAYVVSSCSPLKKIVDSLVITKANFNAVLNMKTQKLEFTMFVAGTFAGEPFQDRATFKVDAIAEVIKTVADFLADFLNTINSPEMRAAYNDIKNFVANAPDNLANGVLNVLVPGGMNQLQQDLRADIEANKHKIMRGEMTIEDVARQYAINRAIRPVAEFQNTVIHATQRIADAPGELFDGLRGVLGLPPSAQGTVQSIDPNSELGRELARAMEAQDAMLAARYPEFFGPKAKK